MDHLKTRIELNYYEFVPLHAICACVSACARVCV